MTRWVRRSAVVSAAILAGAVGILATPARADAATGTVYVEDHTGSAWPVTAATTWVDGYTGSHLTYGTCRTGHRCIRVYEASSLTWNGVPAVAITTYPSWPTLASVLIRVNHRDAGYSYKAKLNTLDHELGHANGIFYHDTACTLMHQSLTCDGRLRPFYWTAKERDILASH